MRQRGRGETPADSQPASKVRLPSSEIRPSEDLLWRVDWQTKFSAAPVRFVHSFSVPYSPLSWPILTVFSILHILFVGETTAEEKRFEVSRS